MRKLKKELWPHVVSINIQHTHENDTMTNIEEWLGKQLGCFKDKWNCVYRYNGTDFYFRNEADAVLFALRWS